MVADFGGKGSCERLEESMQCPKCKKKGAYYLGSDCLHGNPFTPAADTEVEHHYRCANEKCRHEFTRFV